MSPRLSDVFLRTQTDERLAALAGHGHERAFGVLVERYRDQLIRVAGRLVGSDRAEDVAQQTLLRAWSAIQAGTTVGHVSGWLHQILRNTAYTEHARSHEHSRLTDEMADLHSSAADAESRLTLAAILTEMDRLPEHQRYALLQSELGGHSRHDVAVELGVSEGAVRQLVHRARNTLRMAATAITPFPMAAWAAARPGARSVLAHRMAELAGQTVAPGSPAATAGGLLGGGGGLLGGGALLKGGAAVLVAGALGGGLAIKTLVLSSPAHHSVVEAPAGEVSAAQRARGLLDSSGGLASDSGWAAQANGAESTGTGHGGAASLTAVNVRSPSVSRTGDRGTGTGDRGSGSTSGSDVHKTTDGGGSSTQSSGGGDRGSGSSSDTGSASPKPPEPSKQTSTDEQSPTPSPEQSSTTPSTTTTPSTDQSQTTPSTTSSADQSGTSESEPGS